MVPVALKAKLRTDPKYLRKTVCDEFQKYDSFNRGLITAAAFSRVLEDLGLKYGQREVDEIMRYCVITDDGYVRYKDLLEVVFPKSETPPAGPSTSTKEDFGRAPEGYPTGKPQGSFAEEQWSLRDEITADRVERIRKAYARWDRGVSSDGEFKQILVEQIGAPLTEYAERMLSVHGPSRNLSFAKLMHSLQIDESVRRKGSRDPTMAAQGAATPDPTPATRVAQNPPRNPVTWNDDWVRRGQQHTASNAQESGNTNLVDLPMHKATSALSRGERLHQAICEFCDGRTPSLVFRAQLERCGVRITGVVDRLIRRHESDNSTQFKDFAQEIFRNTRMDDVPGTGDRPEDFDEIRLAPPALKGDRPPYASGGAWSLNPEGQNRNVEEFELRMRTPFATDFNVEQSALAKAQAPPPVRSTPKKNQNQILQARAAACAGDILAWREDMADDSPGAPTQTFQEQDWSKRDPTMPGWRSNGDIITWSNPDEPGPEDRLGRRCYGRDLTRHAVAAPFGTEANMKGHDPWLSKSEFRPAMI